MNQATKVYIYSVIASGGLVLAGALENWSSPDLLPWTIYLLLSVGVVAGEGSSWFERGYDERTLATVAKG